MNQHSKITEDQRIGNYMHVFSGGIYWPMDPRPEEVQIVDIAHSLSMKARYNGHTKFPYSVAQHSRYVAIQSVPGHNSPEERLARLLHDGSEAYNGDLIRPLKYDPAFRAPFQRVEELNEAVISKKFNLPFPFERHVKIADEAVTAAECRQILNKNPGIESNLHDDTLVAPIKIKEEHWTTSKSLFLALFNYLSQCRMGQVSMTWESEGFQATMNKFL